jgi:hypothetical protein
MQIIKAYDKEVNVITSTKEHLDGWQESKFSVIQLTAYEECIGVRLVWFDGPSESDHHGRALLGLSLNYSSLVIELLYIKIRIG